MPPFSCQQTSDTNEHDFIATLQKALGKPAGQSLTVSPTFFGDQPKDSETRLAAYNNRTCLDRQTLQDTFTEQAGLINMQVIPVENIKEAGLAIRKKIRATTPEWGGKKSVIAWHHPLIDQMELDALLSADDGTFFSPPATSSTPNEKERREFRDHLQQSYIGITTADFCVAASATLVMRTRPDQPRAVSLVPSIHIAVIKQDQIIKDLTELYFRLKWDPKEQELGLTNCMTFISGPSKTGDIELVMVHGAHGPRELIVYVVAE